MLSRKFPQWFLRLRWRYRLLALVLINAPIFWGMDHGWFNFGTLTTIAPTACRTGPSVDANVRVTLLRGQAVKLMANRGAWTRIYVAGHGICWVLTNDDEQAIFTRSAMQR
jgi:hypothetical protein